MSTGIILGLGLITIDQNLFLHFTKYSLLVPVMEQIKNMSFGLEKKISSMGLYFR